MTNLNTPQIGDEIYVPRAMYREQGNESHSSGGLATVRTVIKTGLEKEPDYFIYLEGIVCAFSWKKIAPIQSALAKRFGKKRASLPKTEADWVAVYEAQEALWIHDGNPVRPHVRLRSGDHSNGFFHTKPVIANDDLLREISSSLIDWFEGAGGDITQVDCVVGPATGATKMAEFLSIEISQRTGMTCYSASPVKQTTEAGEKIMVFDNEERTIQHGSLVLLCEDVLTTGGSVELTEKAVSLLGGTILPFILTLVNRSNFKKVGSKRILPLIHRPMPIWEPGKCPLCPQSEAIPAKEPAENWALLNAQYQTA